MKQEKRTKNVSNHLTCCGPGMPVGPEVASDRDDVDAKTADLGLSEERSGYLVYQFFSPHFSLVKLVLQQF